MSLHLPADATFGDVAVSLGKIRAARYCRPVAIDVTLSPVDA
jgi:hypothetical protein